MNKLDVYKTSRTIADMKKNVFLYVKNVGIFNTFDEVFEYSFEDFAIEKSERAIRRIIYDIYNFDEIVT